MTLQLRYRLFILLFSLSTIMLRSQGCFTITAGTNTTICQGACATLTAAISSSVLATTSYSAQSIPHTPFPYTGGTNAFAFATDDIWSQPINIGFNFCYFGTNFTQCVVGSNGQISFSTALAGGGNGFNVTTALPSLTDLPGNTICGAFRDIDPSQGGVIRTYTTGVAPCRKFVTYWSGVPQFGVATRCPGTPSATFQIVLSETSNIVEVFVNNSSACAGNSNGNGIIGVQNVNATVGTAAPGRNFPGAWTAINEGWRFRPNGASVSTISWSGPSGIVGTGSNVSVCPLTTSSFSASLLISNCNGSTTTFTTTPVLVTVNPSPTITANSSTNNICPGSAVTLSATGAVTFTWNPGNIIGSTAIVNPTTTTTYTVIGTSATSCTNSALVIVNVLPPPVVSINASPTSVCIGGSSTLTASGLSTFTWLPSGNNASTEVVNPIVTSVFTVSGTNASGCSGSQTTTVTVIPPPVVTINASSNPVCAGSSTTLTANGASSYTWSTGATATSIVVTPTANTTFSVIGDAGAGCTGTANITVSVTPLFPIIITPSSSTVCPNTSVSLFASAAAINYTWLPVNIFTPTVSVSPSVTTVYTVIASNLTCTNSATATITTLSAPILNPVASPTAICPGGSSTLTASGALTYTWNPGNINTPSFVSTPLVSTTFTVSGTNALGCTTTNTVDLVVNSNPTVSTVGSSTAICAGSSGTLNASGATSFTWNPGNIPLPTVVVSPTITTIFTVTGESNGCTNVQTLTMTVNAIPVVNASGLPSAICLGQSTTLTAIGATSYTWNPGNLTGSSVTVSPSASTTFTVVGSNAANCTNTAFVVITVNPLPTILANANPTAICASGNVTLSASGAATYTWNPGNLVGATVNTPISTTTTFTVNGTSAAGCTNSAAVTVTVNTAPVISIVASPTAICVGGSATLTASGSPSFTWNPGGLTGTSIIVTPTVTTTFTAIATNGACTSNTTITVVVNPLPTINATANPTVICSGNTATLTATGAATYTWNPGNLNGAIVTVTPGVTTIFNVVGTSALGCSASTTVNLNVIPTPTVNATASNATICLGNSTTLTASGAATYTWNPGNITTTVAVVSPTTSTVFTLTGANGICSSTRTIAITVNPTPTIIASASPTTICSGNTATLTASGATSFTWNPGNLSGATVTVSPATSTVFTVTGTSALGCISSTTQSLFVTPTPTVNASATSTNICIGNSTTLSASGAASFTWNPGNILTATAVVSPTVTTTFTVTGAIGACSSTRTITIVVNPLPTVSISSTPAAICVGGSATLTGLGASTYTWNPGNLTGTSVIVSPSVTTIFTVVGTSVAGCNNSATFTLTVNPIPVITANATPTNICSGATATLSALGATSFTWNPGNIIGATVTVSPNSSTQFTVTGTNALGCIGTRTVNLTVTPSPTVTASATSTNICIGNSTTLSALGATSFTWNPGNILTATAVVSPTVTTIFTVTGANGACSSTRTITIVVNPLPAISIVSTPTAICAGDSATLTASGASTYTWNPGGLNGTSVLVSPSVTTVFTVTGTSAAGCNNTATFTLTVNPLPILVTSATPTSICSGATGTLSASGAVSFTWNPGNLTGSTVTVSPANTTVFTVTGTSAFGCKNSATQSLFVTPTPTIIASASPTPVCLGNSVTLTAIGASSFTWNPGNLTGSPIVVTPSTTTSFTVNGSIGNCTSTAVVLPVFVVPNPALSVTVTPGVICSGDASTLTVSGASTFTWLPSGLTGASTVVTPTSTSIFTVIGASALGCIGTQTAIVVVNPSPIITVNAAPSSTICAGSSVSLTANGATTYTWLPLNINGTTIVDTPTSTTTYTIIGQSPLGCFSTTTTTVSVLPIPTISIVPSSTSICTAGSVTLTGSGATTFTWLPTNTNGSVLTDSPSTTTTYTLIGDNGSCTSSQTISITVNTTPTISALASLTNVCSGTTVSLTATGATSYTWNPGSITGSTVVVTPTITTTYSVQGDNGTNCLSNISLVTVSVVPAPSISITSTSTNICIGSSATLTANGALTYTWLPSANTGTTEVVTPTITTTYTLIGQTGLCQGQNVITVSVQPIPVITATNSAGAGLCGNSTVTLTASGATNYTWTPGNLTGSSVTVAPLGTTTYTAFGDNGAGCTGSVVTTVNVLPTPTLNIFASSFTICSGGSTTLVAAGANSYTWIPFGITSTLLPVSPTATTVYTLQGSNGTCSASTTATVVVNPLPSLTVTASPSVICGSGSSTLTASGATTYFWSPGSANGASVVVTPTANTVLTVTGFDANSCSESATIAINIGTVPTGVVASNDGPISCTLSAVNLSATASSTNVSYNWSGPGSYTSAVQSPTGINVPGVYTVTVTDLVSTCTTTAVTTVTVDPSVPQLTVTSSGSLSCNTTTVSITAVTNATNASFSWTGPNSFTASTASITIGVGGTYSLTVVNLTSNCPASTVITVSGSTNIAVTATITPATCTGSVANNNGTIILGGFSPTDKYDLVVAATYTGTATFATASTIAVSGIITNTLANPSTTVAYTVRIFDRNGCTKDITLILNPTICQTPNFEFGVAKAVSTPSLQTNGSYNITYSVVAQNNSFVTQTNIVLTESLSATFPAPTTFSIIAPPVLTNTNSGLVLDPSFNGNTQAALTTTASILNFGERDTIVFQLNIVTNGVFGPFNNSVLGTALTGTTTLRDSSQTGLLADSNGDGNFADNNQPTVISFTPFNFFGITKEGKVSPKLSDNSYDVTYTVTVHNLGNDTLRNVLVKDSLFQATIKSPASYSIKSGPITSGMLIANSGYNGNSDIRLVLPAASKVSPLSTERIIFTINVVPDTVTIIRNSATGKAFGSGNIALIDTSNSGSNPDTDADSIWNEPIDNVPTVLILKSDDLFIPDVFTPDGDGKNDFFVIKGLLGNVEYKLLVFNRWGNKVYENPTYDNTWNGIPNVSGTLGSQKLPQGTYYYIFEAKDGGKPITGFVVLQY
jgi:gliding motility-associated-like protein